MRRLLHPALVIASAVAVATCADAPTGPRNARTGSLLHGRVAVAARLTSAASETAGRLTQFGFAIDNIGITLSRVTGGAVVLDTTIAVTPGQTLSLALPVTVTTVDEQFIARVVMRQGTTVLYAGEHRVGATLDGATTPPPPVVIDVEYAGPGATATRITITPRDSVFPTTARPVFAVTATDAAGATVTGVPIVWSTSDAAMATVDATTGVVTPGNRRGAVTLRALALSGLTDTLPLTLLSPATSVTALSGAGQTGTAGQSLAAPLVVQVLAADGLPAAGETVAFTATGTGTITPATAVTSADGRASATIVLGAQLGEQSFSATVGSLAPATVTQHAVAGAAASVIPASADTIRGIVGQALATPLAAHVRDALGLPVSAATVRWSVGGGGGTLAGDTSVTAADGATSIGFTFGTLAGISTVTARSGDASASFTLAASHDLPARLSVVSGDAQRAPPATALTPFVVRLSDQHGNPVAGRAVSWTRTRGSGSLAAAASVTDGDGIASVAYTTGTQAGTDSIEAVVAGLEATFVVTTEAGAPATLAVVAGDGQVITAGTVVPIRLKARVTDANGNGVASVVDVTVTSPGDSTASETGIATDSAGYVLVPLTLLERPRIPGTYTAVVKLQASPAIQAAFTLSVIPAPAAAIIVVSAPATATSGILLSPPPVVQLVDSLGNPSPSSGVPITVSTAGPQAVTGTTTIATDSAGRAVYADLAIDEAGVVTLTFDAEGLAGASRDVAVDAAEPPPAARIAVVAGDGQTVVAGTVIPVRMKLQVVDSMGTGVQSLVDVNVTMPGDSTRSETGIATDSAGYVFVPLTLLERPRVAGTYTAVVKLQASPAIQAALTLSVVPAPAAAITIVAAPASASSGAPLSPQPSLQLVDSLGNLAPAAGVTITATATDSAALTGTVSTPSDSSGRASFTDLVLTGRGTTTVSFDAPGLVGAAHAIVVTSVATEPPPPQLTVTPAGPAELRISQFHASVGGLGVIVRDSVEAPVAGVAVHFSVPSDGSHGTFGGSAFLVTATTDSSGIARFDDWRPPTADGSYAVTSQAQVNDVAVSSPVVLGAVRSTWTYSLTVSPASPVAGTAATVAAALLDGAGAAVAEAGRTLTWSSSASLDSTTSLTDSSGIGRRSVTTPPAPAVVTVSVTDAAGVAGAMEFESRTAGGSVTVTPQHDTLTSIGDTRQLSAAFFDGSGAPATGTFTWASRNPAALTVDTTGVVTAVANGSSYIVATDIGGISDSALVVVQQRVASVHVTPGSLALRLTGRQQFTAAAVDGRGHPIGSPSFAWASTVPSIASVDSMGAVEALSLGTTEIRATSGGVTGVATLTVQTPITRIAVWVDSAGVPIADGSPLPALGASRRFIAIAHDTLDQPMSDVTFAWASSNPSVAQLDSIGNASVYARAAANGFTNIRATVHGVTGSATLIVQQALASIQLSPSTATIGVSGTVGTIARGVDANGFFIPAGSFAYTSSTPAVATVGAASGVVTGVAVGSTTITAASGNITSSPGATITVSASVPPVISFGRDTLSVGRGATTSIPLFLSTPHAGPVTVQLSVADTFAYFNPATVTFAANQTAVNATLVGRNAGITTVHAVDASETGFAGDTAALAVQATLRMATSSYTMNATDSRATQVLLSDPSPPGGTYVPLAFGTSGVASASPNPAFIPEGQLAADVVITGTSTSSATVSTTIVPSAIGVNGTAANITVHPASLRLSTNFLRLGAGQYREDMYAYVGTNQTTSLTLTLTSSDTTVATVPASVTIPAGSYYAYFRTSARAPGNATVSVTAPGWSSPTPITMQVTTPRVTACCSASLTTTAPQRAVTVYSTDSLGNAAWRTNSLVVRVVSRDSSIMRVIDSTVTIAAGQYYNNTGRVIPGGAVGTTWVVVDAGGDHGRDSVQYTVAGPQLQWSAGTARIGVGQVDGGLYVYTPHSVTTPLALTITSSDSSIVAPQTAATIPTGSYYHYIPSRGMGPGTATLTVSATGYSPATMTYIATTPRIVLTGGGTVNNFSPPRAVTVYSTDSAGNAHNRQDVLPVRFTSTDTTIARVDTAGTIAAGNYYTNAPRVTFVGVGTASIIATADGHGADTVSFTVVQPQIRFSQASYTLGAWQRGELYIHTPDNRTSALPVTFTQAGGASVLAMAGGDTIPTNTYYRYFALEGVSPGTDTVIVSAEGYRPDTLVMRVTTPRLTSSGLPGGRTTTSPPFQVTVYAADSVGTGHVVADTVVVEVTSSDTTVLRPTARYVRILPNSYYVQPTTTVVGPGTATLTFTDSAGRYLPHTTAATTVTGPSLGISHSTVRLGMGQTSGTNGVYVHVPNNVASPLVVNLASTSTRVATVPPTVTIPAGSYYAYFEVVAGDTVGTIQVQATATGYTASATTVQVTVPRFVISTSSSAYTTSTPRSITVYATDADGASHYVREALTVTLASSAPGVATVDSVTVTIPAGQYYSNTARWSPHAIGTSQITARDDRAVYQKYTTGAANVSVTTPPLFFGSAPGSLGIGQYTDWMYVHTPETQANAVPVTLSHAGAARTSTPASITIPAGSYYTYFRTTGLSAGTDTLIASAASPAHLPDTVVTNIGKGRIDPVGNWPASLQVGDSVPITIYVRDPQQNVRNLVAATTWSLSHNGNIEFRSGGAAITSITIPADADRVTLYVKGVAAGTGSASIASSDYSTFTGSISVVNP